LRLERWKRKGIEAAGLVVDRVIPHSRRRPPKSRVGATKGANPLSA
jgi:hypothetical protein